MVTLLISLIWLQSPADASVHQVPDRVDILAMTDEMKTYLDTHVVPLSGEIPRLQRLAEVVFDRRFLSLTYENDFTRTATEAFEAQSANCLSFTAMFVSMARYVGLNARFQEVTLNTNWERKGDVALLVRHLNARVRIKGVDYVMDFNPDLRQRVRFARPISDARAHAHYYNNRGAESYGARRYEEALGWFRLATETDPEMSYAWSGLGLCYSRLGSPERAETVLQMAIDKDRKDLVAVNNLAIFYRLTDRPEEAERLERRLDYHRRRNPFWHYTLAEQAIAEEDWRLALNHLKTAVRLREAQHEFHFAMAQVYGEMGYERRARQSLQRARRFAESEFDYARYSQKLDRLSGL